MNIIKRKNIPFKMRKSWCAKNGVWSESLKFSFKNTTKLFNSVHVGFLRPDLIIKIFKHSISLSMGRLAR